MKNFYTIIICMILSLQVNAQITDPFTLSVSLTDPETERALTFDIRHGFKLLPDLPLLPKVTVNSFQHSWTTSTNPGCQDFKVFLEDQNGNFNNYGMEKIDEDSIRDTLGNGVNEYKDVVLSATTFNKKDSSDGCQSKSFTQSYIYVDNVESGFAVTGNMETLGYSDARINPSKNSQSYAFCISGVTLEEGRDLMKGEIQWDAKIESHLLGKVKGIRQKGGTNDPIVFSVRDSTTGIVLDSGTLFSVKMTFNSGEDTVDLVNYWANDTVHIESDTAEFFIQYPSIYTSVKGFAHLKVEGGIVTLSEDSGIFDGKLPPLMEDTIHFFLNDSLNFRYNLDTVANYPNIPYKVKIYMYGNSINNYVHVFDTVIFAPPLIIIPSCFGSSDGSVSTTIIEGIYPFTFLWSNAATTQNITGLTAGTYTVTVTDSLGVVSSAFYVLTQPAVLTANCTVTNVTCVGGNNGSISVTATGGTAPYSYTWTTVPVQTTQTATGLTAGAYTVTVTDAKGCTKTSSATIIALNSIPAQPANITGPAAVCKNSLVNYSIAAVTGATSYTWTATSGASVFSGQDSAMVVISFSNAATNASLSVVANNVCGSSISRTKAYVVSGVIPAQPSGISGPLYGLCNLNNVAYNCPAVPNATSYLWSVPAGVNILTGQGTNSITVKYTGAFSNTGSLSVVAQSGCGNSAACIRTVNAKPQQPVISGQNWACKNQPGLVYSVAPVAGATSYTWTIVAGSTLVSGQGTTSIVVNWGSVNGVIYCKANNACGSSVQASKPVSFTCKEAGSLFDFSEISLYPNPTSSSVTLQFDGFAEGKGGLTVFDLVGQEVLSKTLEVATGENNYQLDCGLFPKGIYSVRVVYNGMTRNEKLIVQ